MSKTNINKSFYSKNTMLEVSYYRQKETNKPIFLMSIYKCIGHTKSKDGKELPLFRAYNDVKEDRCSTKMDYNEIALMQKLCEVASTFGMPAAIKLIKELEPNQQPNEYADAKMSIFHSETIVEIAISQKYSGIAISLAKFKDPNKSRYSFMIRRNELFGFSSYLSNLLLLNVMDESEEQPNWDQVRKKNIPETSITKSSEQSQATSTIIDDLFVQ